MEVRVAEVTFSVAEPVTVPVVAVIVVVPALMAVIRPLVEEMKFATPPFRDDHVTRLVTSLVLPSTNVPIAAS
jgi:hypothetical protein